MCVEEGEALLQGGALLISLADREIIASSSILTMPTYWEFFCQFQTNKSSNHKDIKWSPGKKKKGTK